MGGEVPCYPRLSHGLATELSMKNVQTSGNSYLVFEPGELRLVVRRFGGVVELQARDRATALALHALSSGAIRVPDSTAVQLRVLIDDRSPAELTLWDGGPPCPRWDEPL